jgi:hypothetical protein
MNTGQGERSQLRHTGNERRRLKIVGISDASMLADDFLRGGVNGSFDIPDFILRSSSLFSGTLKGGV